MYYILIGRDMDHVIVRMFYSITVVVKIIITVKLLIVLLRKINRI
jgi:hypothetical protein